MYNICPRMDSVRCFHPESKPLTITQVLVEVKGVSLLKGPGLIV